MTSTDNWKNVNNWHWVERDCSDWAYGQIRTRLEGLEASCEGMKVCIESVEDVSGDITVTQRKGRLRHNFDLSIDFKWKAEPTCEQGSVEIRDFMSDTEQKSFEFNLKSASKIDPKTKSFILSAVRDCVWQTLQEFAQDLLDEQGKHIVIPANSSESNLETADTSKLDAFKKEPSVVKSSANDEKPATKNWKQKVEFFAPASEIFRCLVEPDRIKMWSRSPVSGSLYKPGDSFELFSGSVNGSVEGVDVIKHDLRLRWRLSAWPKDCTSVVHIQVKDERSGSILTLNQTGIPTEHYESTSTNWTNYYWNPIKSTFGFGSVSLL